MSSERRAAYLKLCETYFHDVVRGDLEAVRAHFTREAFVTIYHGDNQRRRFYYGKTEGDDSVNFFYGHLFQNYHVKFYDFTFVIDAEGDRGSCFFQVTLTPLPGSSYTATGPLQLNNCNFFRFEGGKIADMIIYYANPTLGAAMGDTSRAPTAFPKG